MAIEEVIAEEVSLLESWASAEGGIDPRILAGAIVALIDVLKLFLDESESRTRFEVIQKHSANSESLQSESRVSVGKVVATLELVKDLPEFQALIETREKSESHR